MLIKGRIEKVLAKNKRLINEDPQKLSDFIEELKREGFLVKKQYDLPPLDTVGRQLYREIASNSSQRQS